MLRGISELQEKMDTTFLFWLLSLQDYVSLRIEAIRAEYQKMPAFLHEEEQHHLERLQKEGEDIFQQLNESKARMEHSRELLRGMYEDLKQMCHKADVELLQVRADHGVSGCRAFTYMGVFPLSWNPTPLYFHDLFLKTRFYN